MKMIEFFKGIFSHILDHWELAFIEETPQQVIEGKPIHVHKIYNPYYMDYWFADPFILDIDEQFIYVLAEAMPLKKVHKGEIALLYVSKNTNAITHLQILLEEPWHLSFPNIMRENGKIYVYPEASKSGKLYLYELVKNKEGVHRLERKATICDDSVWDSEINDFFGKRMLFTCKQDDFHLDIFDWNEAINKFEYTTSIESDRQNMRMAGALFKVGEKVYCPSQICTPTIYGKAVVIKELSCIDGEWHFSPVCQIDHPHGFCITGLHTYNTYKGYTIVDLHYHNYFIDTILSGIVKSKKAIQKWLKK